MEQPLTLEQKQQQVQQLMKELGLVQHIQYTIPSDMGLFKMIDQKTVDIIASNLSYKVVLIEGK